MAQSREKAWLETNKAVVIVSVLLAVAFCIILYRQRDSRTSQRARYQEVVRQQQTQIESSIAFHQVTHLALYFASLGKTTKDKVTAKMTGSAGGPEHPRILRGQPSRQEIIRSLGQPSQTEGEVAIWTAGSRGEMATKLSARFQKDRLVSATFENGQYREHVGTKVEEWQWHGTQ